MKRTSSVVVILLIAVTAAVAADFWNSKPYPKWSQGDAMRLLTNSPWAKTVTFQTGTLSGGRRGGMQNVADSDVVPMINYAISIRSAMPIRQANARLAAITRKYDKMSDGEKQEFDAKWNQYLAQQFPDSIIIAVNYESNVPDTDRQLARFFQSQTLDTMKATTALVLPDGKRVDPTAFAAGGHEMQIAFPRSDLKPGDSFSVEFKHPDVTDQPARVINAKFQVKDMTFNGAPAY